MSANKIYEGPITVTRRGTGFFSYDENEEDLLIPPESLNTAFPGDTVKVVEDGMIASPPKGGRPGEKRKAGKVVEVVSRARDHFVGLLDLDDRFGPILQPDLKKMYVPFDVSLDGLPKGLLGHKVIVKFTGWEKGAELPSAEFVEDIGLAGNHETEMRALALSQGFSNDFPPAVETEAKNLEANGYEILARGVQERLAEAAAGRRTSAGRDFRGVPTFTIDPADAKDFDDALSVRALDGGKTEVGVHIADVSYFVRPGTAIDNEARARATSVYLVDRTIPMLPHVLSNGLCSLNPDEDRLAVSAVFTLDEDANILDRWFGETVIHSVKRFTYENAQEVLDAKSGTLHDELALLKRLADKIRDRRVKNGAIEFDTPEVKVILDETGKPVEVTTKIRQATNLLIEDFMLTANVAVAEYLAERTKESHGKIGAIYRVHDLPDEDRIENLGQFLKVLGYDLKQHGGKVKGTEINALLDQVKGKPEEYLIKTATLRSMSKAVYSTKNAGHFGLAFSHYTHFTSPIRRYPDLMVHRLVKHFAHGEAVPASELADFDRMALHSSEREVAASEAERDSVKMKLAEYMADKIGQEFEGVISGVSDRGIYVELNDIHAEGMIRIRDLGDDYYVYDEPRYRIVGERTKQAFALGDPIKVKLTGARPMDRELDFAPAA
jgi:ribonuclease R